MKTLALARDFGSNALDLAWERRKTVLAVIGGATVIAVAGVIVSRLLRARAEARTSDTDHGDQPIMPKSSADSLKTNVGKGGAGSSASMAKAAKL